MSQEEPNITPGGVSPRHQLSHENFGVISKDLEGVGHVILENCIEWTGMEAVKKDCVDLFAEYEKRFKEGKMSDDERMAHLNATRDFPAPTQKAFTKIIRGSQFLNLIRSLLDSKKIIMFRNDQCLRKISPNYPLRVVGLHYDTQFVDYVDRTFTLWVPLTDVLEDSPTVLYLHRSLTIPFNSIDPDIRWQETTQPDEAGDDYETQKERRERKILAFIKQNIAKTYAPRLKVGDAIIFCHDVLHGTFLDSNAKQTRYSLDCRFSKDFDRSDEKAAVKKEAPEGLHTLYASPGPASKIRTVTFNPNGSLFYTPHESHPDVENGTPTYDGYHYAKKHSLKYDFKFYENNIPDLDIKTLLKLAISQNPARKIVMVWSWSMAKQSFIRLRAYLPQGPRVGVRDLVSRLRSIVKNPFVRFREYLSRKWTNKNK